MTLIVVGLLCLLLGIALGVWCGIEIADAFHKPIYKRDSNVFATCTCYGPRETEEMK